jgi:hypothetical protein
VGLWRAGAWANAGVADPLARGASTVMTASRIFGECGLCPQEAAQRRHDPDGLSGWGARPATWLRIARVDHGAIRCKSLTSTATVPVYQPRHGRPQHWTGYQAHSTAGGCGNEERFWFGGAAHKRCRGRWRVGTAPVSQKRVGLNRQPPDGYGDSWCRPADEHARTAASRRARIGAMAGAMACSGALPTSGVASWHRPGACVPMFASDETPCGMR